MDKVTEMSEYIDRRKNRTRMTITQILEHMQHVADDEYTGDLQENALTIFTQLNIGDKKTFLRKSLMLHWENQIAMNREGITDVAVEDMVVDQKSIEHERKLIDDSNFIEQKKMKSLISKLFFMIGIVAFIAMFVMTTTLGPAENTASSLWNDALEAYKYFTK